jgi:hypothetical protein
MTRTGEIHFFRSVAYTPRTNDCHAVSIALRAIPAIGPFRPFSAALVSENAGIVMTLSCDSGWRTNVDPTAATMCAPQSSTLRRSARCRRECGCPREIFAACAEN